MDAKILAGLEKIEEQGEDVDSPTARKIAALIYGDFGVGKTTLLGQIVKAIGEPAILINTDSAWTVLQKDPEVSRLIKRYPFDSFAAIRMMVQAHDEGIEPWASRKLILLDTITTMIDTMLREIVKGKKFPTQQVDPDLEAYPHYRMVANSLKDTIKVIKKSDMHLLCTGHIKEPTKQDKEDRVVKRFAIRPNAPEASYSVIAQEANLLGWQYLEKAGQKPKIQFNPTLQETAKSQVPGIDQKTYETEQIPELILKYLHS